MCAHTGYSSVEPLEQRRLLAEPARGPLIQVVVAVDEPGRCEAAAAIDPAAFAARRRARADRDDPAALDHDVPVGVLGAGGVDGRDRAAFDDERVGHRVAAIRTASRIFS